MDHSQDPACSHENSSRNSSFPQTLQAQVTSKLNAVVTVLQALSEMDEPCCYYFSCRATGGYRNSSFAPFAQILLLKNTPQRFLSLSVHPNNHPCTADDIKTELALHIQKKNKMEVKIHQPRKKKRQQALLCPYIKIQFC